MHSYSRVVLLAALAAAPAFAGNSNKPSKDAIGGKSGRTIHGQTVYPQDHIFANDGEVTLVIQTTSAQGALAALGAGTEAVATSNNDVWYVNVPLENADAVMTKLEQNSGVKYVEFDSIQEIFTDHKVNGDQRYLRRLAEQQPYGIGMVLEDVDWWDDKFENDPPTGSTKLCVVDTGYGNGHEDLPVLPQTDDYGFNPNGQGGQWYIDGHSHGTHCAGSIGAVGDNEKGVVGVIPGSLGGKFSFFIGKGLSDSGSGSTTGVMAAVQACVDKGSNVISMSLGGGSYSNTFSEQYYGHYKNDDVLIIAAAGNSGANAPLSYPASYKSVMSVAAVDSNEDKAGFSQANEQTEIAGPGVDVRSSITTDSGTTFDYASYSGTSMATPHVAAVAGLLRMYFPTCKAFQIRQAMLRTTKDKGAAGCNVNFGHGIIQAKTAFEYLTDNACDPDEAFKEPAGGCAEYSCSANSDCDDGNPDTIDTCQSGTCTYGCTTSAGCDDGNACTTDTCEQGVCNHVDVENGPFTRITVSLTTDNYPGETTWEIKDATSGTTKLEGSGYSDTNTLHESSYCSVVGHDATFTITDAYGDGICCSQGSGSYSIKVDGVDELVTGGQFESSETKPFTVPAYSGSPSPPVVSPTNPPVASPVVSPTNPPVAPPVSAPTNPPVGGDNPGVLTLDLYKFRHTFIAEPACVENGYADGRVTGGTIRQCAQACADLESCAGFVEDGDVCVLVPGALEGCDGGSEPNAKYYKRNSIMMFGNH